MRDWRNFPNWGVGQLNIGDDFYLITDYNKKGGLTGTHRERDNDLDMSTEPSKGVQYGIIIFLHVHPSTLFFFFPLVLKMAAVGMENKRLIFPVGSKHSTICKVTGNLTQNANSPWEKTFFRRLITNKLFIGVMLLSTHMDPSKLPV